MTNVLFVVGSTGGHLYPALSIYPYCVKHGYNVTILAPESVKNKLKIDHQNIYYQADISASFSSLATFLKNTVEIDGFIKKIDTVVSFGSVFSIPSSLVAKFKGKKLVLVEQNVLPGRSNRFLSLFAKKIVVPFEESISFLLFKNKAIVMLTPIRQEFVDNLGSNNVFNGSDGILFFGGSLGSRTINELAIFFLKQNILPDFKRIFIITGNKLFGEFLEKLRNESIFNYSNLDLEEIDFNYHGRGVKVLKYSNDIMNLYNNSHLVISRAGGSTISEVLYLKKRALLIPYPYSMDNHQLLNAKVACKYAKFLDYLEEPVDLNKFVEKLDNLKSSVLEYSKQVRFFDYDIFLSLI